VSYIETNFEDYEKALRLEQKAAEKERQAFYKLVREFAPYIGLFVILLILYLA
jgi:hypothetical protein